MVSYLSCDFLTVPVRMELSWRAFGAVGPFSSWNTLFVTKWDMRCGFMGLGL